MATVYQAYMELEVSGLVESRPKSGFFVLTGAQNRASVPKHGKKIYQPAPVRISDITSDVVHASLDPSLVPLGASVLSPELLPHKHLGRITRALLSQKTKHSLSYAPPEGVPELRRLLADRYTGILPDTHSENILVTNGCMEAIGLALQTIIKPGDVVGVESPTHFGFLHLLQKLGVHAVGIPTDPLHGPLPESFDAIIRRYPVKAFVLIPNFHNPLGARIPDEHKKEIVLLANKHDIPIIEDDIYGELFFDGQRPSLLKEFDQKDLVITCSSVSKVLAAGFRIGWCLPGTRFMEDLAQRKSAFSLCAPTLQQNGLCQFLSDGIYDRYLRSLRTRVQRQMVQTSQAISRHFPPATKHTFPQGGNMLWVELPEKVNGVEVYQRALGQGVSIVPGQAFAITGEFGNFIRISATSPFDERIDDALHILGRIVHELMDN